jgi:hypothetical protein
LLLFADVFDGHRAMDFLKKLHPSLLFAGVFNGHSGINII